MTERRVNWVGKSTATVSLPAEWVRLHSLTQGSSVHVEESGVDLLVSARAPVSAAITLDARGRSPYCQKLIIQAYKKGYDEIRVLYDAAGTLDAVTEVLGVLIGFEILEQDATHVVLRNVAGKLDADLTQLMDRAVVVTTSMIRGVGLAFETRDEEVLRKASSMEQINNRLCLLSERLIVRQGYLHDYRAGLFIMVFMYKLENLADSVRMLCDILLRNSPLLASKLVRQSYGQVRDLYETLVEFVHDGNRAKLDLMQDARLGFAPKLLTDTGSGSVAQARVLAAMHRIVLEIYDLAGIRLATTI